MTRYSVDAGGKVKFLAEEVAISRVAAALSNPYRASIMLALLEGESLSAGALAHLTGLSTSRTSGHLRRLEQLALIASDRAGRNRYVRLFSPEVAAAIDALARIAPREGESTGQREDAAELSAARTCYDHLAGGLGVTITEAFLVKEYLVLDDERMRLTRRGESWFGGIGIDLAALKARPRVLARPCLDWTLQRPHLAGAIGAELTSFLFAKRLISPRPGSRGVDLTASGAAWLDRELGIAPDWLPTLGDKAA